MNLKYFVSLYLRLRALTFYGNDYLCKKEIKQKQSNQYEPDEEASVFSP